MQSRAEDGASSPELKSLATTSKPKAGPSKGTNAAKHATQNKENEEAAGKRNNQEQHSKQALLAPRSSNAAGAAEAEGDKASPTKRGRAGHTKSAAEPASQPEPAAGKASRKSMPASKAAADAAVLARAAALKRKSAPPAVEPAAAAQGAAAGKANSKKGKSVSAQQAEQVDAEGDVIMTQAAKPGEPMPDRPVDVFTSQYVDTGQLPQHSPSHIHSTLGQYIAERWTAQMTYDDEAY